ncbi:MAG: sigma-54-dependent Fis family transcriptional regulator [Cytophagaceae bacterium]|nr:sigma-54-dependent Fis family transcriptional regulator [Cytophagaceae bacterium]|tara:strand:+ start:27751 stop:29121 length:1371 start_codon:yes stop_codon:yes gene_type:complete
MAQVLLIEDDVAFCKMLEAFLTRKDFDVRTAFTAESAFAILEEHPLDLVITDVRLPDKDGLEILAFAKKKHPDIPVILMTGYAEVPMAVEAMKKGAFDYISKPFQPGDVLDKINAAVDDRATGEALPRKREENPDPPKKTKDPVADTPSAYLKGLSDASAKLNQYIDLVAPTTMSVLIMGDSGTGKEYVAKSIHEKSKRAGKPFIPVDCGAIPKEIASSEFFGHKKGSFTGAVDDKIGHFEEANGGTLFLDEIGNLSYELQVQLLRALQERQIKPVGSSKEIPVDIRVIAATNEDLEAAAVKGDFREDLYHRLNEFSIHVPQLKDRGSDLMLFANLFLKNANTELEKEVLDFDEEVITVFENYQWPGNLREMKNIIKRLVLLADGNTITPGLLPRKMFENAIGVENDGGLYDKDNEKEMILNALERASGNKSKAARLLKIDRKTLYNKLDLYEIKT